MGRNRLDSHLRRQWSKCQLRVGGGWEEGRGVLFTAPTRRQFGVFILPPSSTERQLSNSFQCVKSNLYSLAGCNMWVLNKEEDTNVWPSLKRVPHTGVKEWQPWGSSTQQSNANGPGWLSQESRVLRMPTATAWGSRHWWTIQTWSCVPQHMSHRMGRCRLCVYMAGRGGGAEGTLHPLSMNYTCSHAISLGIFFTPFS